MIFTSYTYLIFLGAIALLYALVPSGTVRKGLLLTGSYVFYCSWNWRFGFLLLGVSVFNWAWGRFVVSRREELWLLWVGIIVDLAPLLFWKYTSFFLRTANDLLGAAGSSEAFRVPKLILPLGISFFTFQGVAYLVDVAGGERPFRKLRDFLLYKAFWPQLIAGPIIRPAEIRAQIESVPRPTPEDFGVGCQRILQGFLKKVVLADNLSPFVEQAFAGGARVGMVDTVVGTLGFALQIYFDFSGYSDIAIGSARLFGFRFPENFDWPYLAASPRDFWNRWHMTLSRWIRDYVFSPMSFGLRRRPRWTPAVLVVSMAICGLWHGAAWTFVIWGVWHGVMLVLGEGLGRLSIGRRASPFVAASLTFAGRILTLVGVAAAWIWFRAVDVGHAVSMTLSVLRLEGGLRPQVVRENTVLFVGLVVLGVAAWHLVRALVGVPVPVKWLDERAGFVLRPVCYSLAIVLVIIADRGAQPFVYFQF